MSDPFAVIEEALEAAPDEFPTHNALLRLAALRTQLERYERALGVYRSELERMAKQQTILIGNPYGSSLRQTLREGDAALSEPSQGEPRDG